MKVEKKVAEKAKPKFVKVQVKDNGSSLMQCGSGALCNESRR